MFIPQSPASLRAEDGCCPGKEWRATREGLLRPEALVEERGGVRYVGQGWQGRAFDEAAACCLRGRASLGFCLGSRAVVGKLLN